MLKVDTVLHSTQTILNTTVCCCTCCKFLKEVKKHLQHIALHSEMLHENLFHNRHIMLHDTICNAVKLH